MNAVRASGDRVLPPRDHNRSANAAANVSGASLHASEGLALRALYIQVHPRTHEYTSYSQQTPMPQPQPRPGMATIGLAASHPGHEPTSVSTLLELDLHRVRLGWLLMSRPCPLHPLVGGHGCSVAAESNLLTPQFDDDGSRTV